MWLKRRAGSRFLCTVLVLGVAGCVADLGGGTAHGLDLLDAGDVFGTGNPLADLPPTLPEHAAGRGTFNLYDLYRSRAGDRRHDYWLYHGSTAGMVRLGSVWIGARYENRRLDLRQRNVFSTDDGHDGGRKSGRFGLAVAGVYAGWEARALIGRRDGRTEGAVQLAGSFGPLARFAGRGWVTNSELDFAQRFDETTFYFPFRYRDECAEIEIETKSWKHLTLGFTGGRKTLVGRKTLRDQYNLLYLDRWRAGGFLRSNRSPQPRLGYMLHRGKLNLAMAMSGTRYAEIRDLHLTRHCGTLEWRWSSTLDSRVGVESWRITADGRGYVDVWPFWVWDVFTATRYVLEAAEKSWTLGYVGIGWEPGLGGGHALRLEGQFEWWRDEGSLQWKRRVPTIPPFFFKYQHHEDDLAWPYTHVVQIELDSTWRISSTLRLSLAGRQIIPLSPGGEGGGEPSAPGAGVERSHRGGLSLTGALDLAW
ncbi:MAG: hypothetical protein GF355_13440 [Candidatus Eisenbacteria bacterium]|nr:hypothetical protein [Candidatus Eisenbacteria bacterium]